MYQNLDLRFLLFYCILSSFFSAPFHFFDLTFYCLCSFFDLVYDPLFPPSFSFFFCLCFLAHVVSSLAYPNLFETKRLRLLLLLYGDRNVTAIPAGAGI
jgi:hypothetical protein